MSKLFLYQAIKNCSRSGEEVILAFAEEMKKDVINGVKRFTRI